MTASLPVPNDIDPEEPDRHPDAPVVALPASAPASSSDAAASAPRTPRPKPKPKPRSKRPASGANASTGKKASASRAKSTDSGAKAAESGAKSSTCDPSPSAPGDLDLAASAAADILVPPKPPLPLVEAEGEAARFAAPAEAVVEAESESTVDVEPAVESEPVETAAEPVEAEPVETDAEPTAEAEPVDGEAELAGEPETGTAEPETEAEGTPDLAPAAAEASDALVLRGVTKRFGSTHAVDGIDLTVPAGTFYGLVGPNGAGKTTTLSMIAGLLDPDRGTIRVGGVDASADPRGAKKLMGVLPDRLRTFDRLTGRQLLHYYGVLRGLPPAVVESRTVDLARAFDLGDALGRRVSDYSAGMLKKVMLAGALIHSPRLLVLDEPFEAVDPVSSAIILDILSTYVAHGGTVILSSHGMELVERVCTRVAVIVAGQVLAEGTVAEVRGELTLEQRFVELAGGLSDVEGLEWLHTFSS